MSPPGAMSRNLSPRADGGKALPMDEARKPTREERLAEKLRENLRRRKAQARAMNEREAAGRALPKAPEDG